ncbi:MAG: hypothetical protein ACI4A3_08065 [Lachnospiraceae bacterium]
MEDDQKYVQVLVATLQKQVQVLNDILKVTQEQSAIANAIDFDESMLEESLNKKEILIAKLNELDNGFVSVYGRVRNEIMGKQKIYKEEISQLQSLIKECTDLGVEIKVAEERNRDKMAQCFANKHKDYGAKRTAASVASRYHQTMNNAKTLDSYFFNQKN